MGLTDVIKRVAEVFTDSSAPGIINNAAQTGARQISNILPDLPMGPAGDAMGDVMGSINSNFQSSMGQIQGGFGNAMGQIGGAGSSLFGNSMPSIGGRDPFGGSMSFGGGRDPFGGAFTARGNPWSNRDMFSDKMTMDKMKQEAQNQANLSGSGSSLSGGQASGLSGDPSKAQVDKLKGTDKWNDMILRAAQESGVPASVIKGLMAIESGGNATIGTNTSGATGLMQVVGSIWQGTANNFGGDLNDPWVNIRTGAEVLKTFHDQYGSWEAAISAYLGSPEVDAQGNYIGPGDVADSFGTTGRMYLDIAKNNIAWIEQQYADTMPASGLVGGGAEGFGNAYAPNAIGAAQSVLGMPYVWGAYQKEKGGFDCSGLIVWAYNQAGKDMPRMVSQTMYSDLPAVNPNELKAGDLVLYAFPGGQEGADHVAMYIGNGQVIQATSSTGNVTITSADWAQEHIIGYRRVP